MKKIGNLFLYASLLFFAGWCVVAFRADIAQISFASIWPARNAILFAVSLSAFNYLLRIIRWAIYIFNLGYSLPFRFLALTYVAGFAFTLSPAKVGEMVRAHYYKNAGIPISTTAGALFIERLMDLLSMLALALMAFTSKYESLLVMVVVAMVVILLLLGRLPWESYQRKLEQRQKVSLKIRHLLHGILRAFRSARALLRPGLLVFSFFLGLIAWGAEGTGLMILGAVTHSGSITWVNALGIYAIAIIVGAFSFLPGGLGSTEAIMITLLAAHGDSVPDAILVTLLCRLLTLWFAVGLGWIAVLLARSYAASGEAK